jgi:hypothetical protein
MSATLLTVASYEESVPRGGYQVFHVTKLRLLSIDVTYFLPFRPCFVLGCCYGGLSNRPGLIASCLGFRVRAKAWQISIPTNVQ